MARGRMTRGTLRVATGLLLGCLLVVGGWALHAPSATADPAVTVYVRDLTPPVVSVDAGGTVTFVNQIADKTLSVGVGPLAVQAVVHTDVTLELPSGKHTVQPSHQPGPNEQPPTLTPEQSWAEKFAKTCATCTITWTYRVEGAQLTQVLNQLPPLPATTPFVVNTLVPLPNLPGVNVPQLPQVNVPVPNLPSVGVPGQVPGVGGSQQQSVTTTTLTTTTTQTLYGVNGAPFEFALGGRQLAPGGSAIRAFDPSQVGNAPAAGSAQGDGLGSPDLADRSAISPAQANRLPVAALVALVMLAGVGTWLVRTVVARAAR